MLDLLFIISIVGTVVQAVKEAFTPKIPAENWANKELYHKDIMDGVPIEQRMKNLKNGKYKLNVNQCKCNSHPEGLEKEVVKKTKFEERYGL